MTPLRAILVSALMLSFWSAGAVAQEVPIPNPSFELGREKPDGWFLEGGKGGWEKEGHSGKRSISVTGNGSDSNYWRCEALPLEPDSVYRVSFFAKQEGGDGCIISGLNSVNRDFRGTTEWREFSFIFQTPSDLKNSFIRFGQYHVSGKVWFDDIRIVRLKPMSMVRRGLMLGECESIDNGKYRFSSRLSKESSNYSRCCVRNEASFNSNRWVFHDGAAVVYRHQSARQKSGRVELDIGYYKSGSLVVECRSASSDWRKCGEAGASGRYAFQLPAELFPASWVEVRLRGAGYLQVNQYAYEAELAEKLPDMTGRTNFIEERRLSDRLAVSVESVGSLLTDEGNAVKLLLTPREEIGEVEARLRFEPESGEPLEFRKRIAPKGTESRVYAIPYQLTAAGRYKLTISVGEPDGGERFYMARCNFGIPALYAADFGYLFSQNERYAVWWCGATYKVSQDRPLPERKAERVQLISARNEYEPFQLVIRPKVTLRNVSVRVSGLKGANGATIAASEARVEMVDYVRVRIPTDTEGCVGDFPDPLPPCEGGFDVAAGKNQPIWITLHIPEGTPAGEYTGKVEISADNAPTVAIPVNLRVFDFTLPRESRLKVGMNMSKNLLKPYHNLETEEEVEKVFELYQRNMAEHRVANFRIMQYYPPKVTFKGLNWSGGVRTEEESYAGKRSLLIVDDDEKRSVGARTLELIPVTRGKEYELRWFAKTREGHQYLIAVNQYDATKQWISGHNIDIVRRGAGDWREEKMLIAEQITPATRFVSIHLFAARWSSDGRYTGRVYFDEISLRELPDGKNLVADGGFEAGVDDIEMEINFTRFVEAGKKYLDGMGFNVFNVPLYGFASGTFHSSRRGQILNFPQGTPEHMRLFSKYCKAVMDKIIENGWYEKHCVFWFDEPAEKDYPFVREGMEYLKKANARMKRMLTEQPEPELYGFVDIWLPVLSRYDRERAKERQAKGEEIWWYICCGPKAPYPNNFIDHPAIEPRIWFWMTWQNGVTGCHIWNVNYWTSRLAFPPPKLQNPYEDPMSYMSGYGRPVGFIGYWGNGDGRSIYPPNRNPNKDKRKYICGPVNSIRWELIREGIEDYHYFYLLNERVKELEKSGGHEKLVREAKALLEIPAEIITDLTHYTKDPQLLQRHRRKVAEMIEKIGEAIENAER